MYTSADTLQHQGVFVHMGLRDSLAWLDEKREEEGSLTKALQVARLPGVPVLVLVRDWGLLCWLCNVTCHSHHEPH